MEDYLRSTNDWDLDAIIRGWEGVQVPPPSPVLGFDGFGLDFEFEETGFGGGGINELEEMYKPFVVQVDEPKNESPRSSHETETNSPCSSSFAVFDHVDDVEKPKEVDGLDVEDHPQAKSSSCKKRKSKQKIVRVVHRGVGEDGVVLDKWNWRKYGQKAIKGSPYPRSYYRCSSSGVCHARKHIEQSKDDPQTFIVTYIADHTHSPPTRRHAQAGRKITKFASSSTRIKTNTTNNNNTTPPCSDSMTWTISDRSIAGEDEDHQVVLGGSTNMEFVDVEESSCTLGFMKDSFSTDYDHDWSIWEFDPFFSTASVN